MPRVVAVLQSSLLPDAFLASFNSSFFQYFVSFPVIEQFLFGLSRFYTCYTACAVTDFSSLMVVISSTTDCIR